LIAILILIAAAGGGALGGLYGTGVLGGSSKTTQVSVGAPHF
jgi:hypothetical protein